MSLDKIINRKLSFFQEEYPPLFTRKPLNKWQKIKRNIITQDIFESENNEYQTRLRPQTSNTANRFFNTQPTEKQRDNQNNSKSVDQFFKKFDNDYQICHKKVFFRNKPLKRKLSFQFTTLTQQTPYYSHKNKNTHMRLPSVPIFNYKLYRNISLDMKQRSINSSRQKQSMIRLRQQMQCIYENKQPNNNGFRSISLKPLRQKTNIQN